MTKSSIKQKIFRQLSYFCLVQMHISQVQAMSYFASGQSLVPKLTFAMPKQPFISHSSAFIQYQFNQVIPIILALLLIILFLFVLDRREKGRLEQKFLAADEAAKVVKSESVSPEHANKVFSVIGIILLCLVAAIYYFVVVPAQLNQNQFLVKYFGTGLLVFVLAGGYLLGSLKRSKQVESLIDDLQIQIESKKVVQEMFTQGKSRLQHQNTSLGRLAEIQLKDWKNPEEIFREITKVSAETLNVERVSIWLFSQDNQQLECMDLYLKSKNLHTVAKPLQAKELPEYFKYISQHRVIAANDVRQHPSTVEFAQGYANENNVGAMLDGTIWLNGQVIGAICHEEVGNTRVWTLDEQNFVGSVADLARLTIETDRRRKAEQALLKQNESLELVVQARTLSLQESEKKFASVVKYAPIPIVTINMNGDIVEFNPEAEAVTGYGRAQVIGKNFISTFVEKKSLKKTVAIGFSTKKGEDSRGVELLLRCADGRKIEFECSIVRAAQDDHFGSGHMIAIGQDVSQKKALQISLIKAREAAESADRIKSMFVASMSHELRTPLNSIIGFLGVVLQGMSGELNLKQKDQLGRAYHSAKHLLALISEVIDISKIEAGFLNVHVEKFEFKPLLIEVEHAVSHIVEGKNLDLHIHSPAKLKLETDRKRLYQVVLNVVSNALKYTERGEVNVTASIKGKQLIIVVEDTGIGMDEAGLANLFKPFERIESRLKIKTLGTGLGLYLTRKILSQLLGGTIEVKSKLDEGSTFTIVIPTKIPEMIIQTNASILEEPHSKALNP